MVIVPEIDCRRGPLLKEPKEDFCWSRANDEYVSASDRADTVQKIVAPLIDGRIRAQSKSNHGSVLPHTGESPLSEPDRFQTEEKHGRERHSRRQVQEPEHAYLA
jgi:hypothetical protein